MTSIPPIQINFAPAWWRARYGMAFAEPVLRDPIARTELEREQRRLLYERFGDAGLGERDPQPRPSADGAYGHRFMAALWGCEMRYLPDQAPAAVAWPDAADRLTALALLDFERSPVVRQCLAEAETLRRRYGDCDGAINQGGPLNNAVSVLGEAILAACACPARGRAPGPDADGGRRPDHLDVGWGTDLQLVRRTYPSTRLSIEIQAKALIGQSRAELSRMVRQLIADASPIELITRLWVAEAGPEVPDETVRHLITAF